LEQRKNGTLDWGKKVAGTSHRDVARLSGRTQTFSHSWEIRLADLRITNSGEKGNAGKQSIRSHKKELGVARHATEKEKKTDSWGRSDSIALTHNGKEGEGLGSEQGPQSRNGPLLATRAKTSRGGSISFLGIRLPNTRRGDLLVQPDPGFMDSRREL